MSIGSPGIKEISDFFRCLRPRNPFSGGDHIGAAGSSIAESWLYSGGRKDGAESAVFLAIFSWNSRKAQTQWYQDFLDGMDSFERLGHHVACLKTMVIKVESTHTSFRLHSDMDDEITSSVFCF